MNAERNTATHSVEIADVITIAARLAQILAEEADLLANMKVAKIEALQQEKLFLVNALEAQKKYFTKHPEDLDAISMQDRDDLREVVEVFNNVLEENHRRLLMAKEVNHKIVGAITEVVKEASMNQGYDEKGYTGLGETGTISVTLNKQV